MLNGGAGLCLQLEQYLLGQLDQFVHHLLVLLRHDFMDCLRKKEEEEEEEEEEERMKRRRRGRWRKWRSIRGI